MIGGVSQSRCPLSCLYERQGEWLGDLERDGPLRTDCRAVVPVREVDALPLLGLRAVSREEEDEGEAVEAVDVADDDDDIKGDKYIKQPKPKAKRATKKATAGDDDEVDEKPKGRGRAKGGAKGKAKK